MELVFAPAVAVVRLAEWGLVCGRPVRVAPRGAAAFEAQEVAAVAESLTPEPEWQGPSAVALPPFSLLGGPASALERAAH